ncbi:MAG: hypothetical protein HN521_11875 [Candidatus Latescibacteria bacterium]|nr:hypothetical protein [Candidatus Latescibacterota bacterium]MBT5829494.1 hypothetical protein [Candidatus Latescibacterota bacterium]
MNPLARLDLSRFQIDDESFVGQAIALGVQFNKLPPQTSDAMLGFLRAKGLYYGQRNRSGIAIARDGLERGVRQALICLDMGLRNLAEGDLNKAVELLGQGDFEATRKEGYQLAFFQLEEIRKGSLALLTRPTAEFLQEEHRNLKRWSTLVPETWTRLPDDLEEEAQLVDARSDYGAFLQTQARMDFLNSIPNEALNQLQEMVSEGRSFDGLLRNVILALSLNLESVIPSFEEMVQFGKTCFVDGQMQPEIRDKVSQLMDRQLESSVLDGPYREQIRTAVQEEVDFFEQVSGENMAGFFLLPGKSDVTADDLLDEVAIE